MALFGEIDILNETEDPKLIGLIYHLREDILAGLGNTKIYNIYSVGYHPYISVLCLCLNMYDKIIVNMIVCSSNFLEFDHYRYENGQITIRKFEENIRFVEINFSIKVDYFILTNVQDRQFFYHNLSFIEPKTNVCTIDISNHIDIKMIEAQRFTL